MTLLQCRASKMERVVSIWPIELAVKAAAIIGQPKGRGATDRGIGKDRVREEKENPMMYAAPGIRISQGVVSGSVNLIKLASRGKCTCHSRICLFKLMFRSGDGSCSIQMHNIVVVQSTDLKVPWDLCNTPRFGSLCWTT